ncbi:unnamed protein product [Closterium sp. Yama58-4]|nr:unnamed protein product [Closterium sp. Yama58-4]
MYGGGGYGTHGGGGGEVYGAAGYGTGVYGEGGYGANGYGDGGNGAWGYGEGRYGEGKYGAGVYEAGGYGGVVRVEDGMGGNRVAEPGAAGAGAGVAVEGVMTTGLTTAGFKVRRRGRPVVHGRASGYDDDEAWNPGGDRSGAAGWGAEERASVKGGDGSVGAGEAGSEEGEEEGDGGDGGSGESEEEGSVGSGEGEDEEGRKGEEGSRGGSDGGSEGEAREGEGAGEARQEQRQGGGGGERRSSGEEGQGQQGVFAGVGRCRGEEAAGGQGRVVGGAVAAVAAAASALGAAAGWPGSAGTAAARCHSRLPRCIVDAGRAGWGRCGARRGGGGSETAGGGKDVGRGQERRARGSIDARETQVGEGEGRERKGFASSGTWKGGGGACGGAARHGRRAAGGAGPQWYVAVHITHAMQTWPRLDFSLSDAFQVCLLPIRCASCPSGVPPAHQVCLLPIRCASCPSGVPPAHQVCLLPIRCASCPSGVPSAHQWLEFARYSGVAHVFWYDMADDPRDRMEAALEGYKRDGFLTYHHFPSLAPSLPAHHGATPHDQALHHCLTHHGSSAVWLLPLTPVDYLTVPPDIKPGFTDRFLRAYEARRPSASQLLLQTFLFLGSPQNSSALLIQRYQRRTNHSDGVSLKPQAQVVPVVRPNLVARVLWHNPSHLLMTGGSTMALPAGAMRVNRFASALQQMPGTGERGWVVWVHAEVRGDGWCGCMRR